MTSSQVGVLLVGLAVACGRGPDADQGSIPTDPDYIVGGDQRLPPGVVGEPYAASVRATGGVPPIRYDVSADSALPLGLTLASDGTISGVPVQAGSIATLIVAFDAVGQTQRFLADVEIDLVPTLLDCGDSLEGEFTGAGMRPSGPVWSEVTTPNLQWLGIPWPQGDNQRVEIAVDSTTTVGMLVQRPNQPEGSLDWREDYVSTWVGAGSATIVDLDPGTVPSLPSFEVQGLVPVLMVSFGPGDYRLDVACSDGPIFERPLPYPVRLGEDFVIDFRVYGDNSDVTFTIDGELPDWVTVDEAEGTLSGTAMEEITVDLEVTAATSDGRSTTVDSIFGVFDPRPIGCDESRELTFEQSYFDGPVIGFYDPRGYQVFELEVPAGVSAVEWTLDGANGHYLGLVDHDEDQFLFLSGSARDVTKGTARVEVTPRSYPATKHYRDAGRMYAIAAPTDLLRQATLTTSCDEGPRPDLANLPVLTPLVSEDRPLRGIGGVPPYRFSAAGLPGGISIEGDRLVGSTAEVGRRSVDLTVTDALGDSFTDTFDLYVGLDEACEGGTRVRCGDTVTGEFSGNFFQDAGADAQARLCLYTDGAPAAGIEFSSDGGEFHIDVADPGVPGDAFLGVPDRSTYGGRVYADEIQGVALNPFSWPALPDYEGLPVHFALRAVTPGAWSAAIACEPPQ